MASQHDSVITKNRVRAPRQHGQALISPHPSEISAVWSGNRDLLRGHNFQVYGLPIDAVRTLARTHLVAEAAKYTSQYRDTSILDPDKVIISGHQPRLFHSGVWFKNFALSELGESLAATAINLIVDNDLCGLSSVSVPQSVSTTEASTTSVAYDSPGGNLPFENRLIADRETFESFGSRLGEAISGTVEQPLVQQLWKNTKTFTDPNKRLGHTLAAARHKLESQHGLNTLEVPLSTVCQSREFAMFAADILTRISDFQSIFNEAIHEYRVVHGIRSNSHPVPELEKLGDWFETPFWVWSKENPVRRALYLLRSGDQLVLTNRGDLEIKLDERNLAEQLFELSKRQIAIRPRALITTMYSRLVLSDLFMHGIGGSKYDQLTDAIIARFWHCLAPVFLTVTATMKLPFEFERVTEQDIADCKQRIRDLTFHPEANIVNPDKVAAKLIATKAEWISTRQNSESNKQRHDVITDCNAQLLPYVQPLIDRIREKQASSRRHLARTRILDSRGYSFCCFGERLIEELKSMAKFEPNESAK